MQVTNLVSLSTIIILLAFGQVRAESTNLDKFVGDWKGSITATYNGQQTRSTFTASIKKVDNDYVWVSEVNIPGTGSGVSTNWYYQSGELAYYGGVNGSTSLATGTWYSSGNTFYSSFRVEGLNLDYTQDAKYVLVGDNNMTTITTASNGLRGVGEATRITPPRITSNLSTVSLKLGKLMTRYTVTTNFGAKSFSAKGLPAGLQLNATTGIVSGKPSKKGTYTVTFTAAKKQGSKVIQSKTAKKVFKVN
jgi:hypothetical protein